MTSERLEEVKDSGEDMALPAIDLFSSNTLSQDVVLHNLLQAYIGELNIRSMGLSIAQICAQK